MLVVLELPLEDSPARSLVDLLNGQLLSVLDSIAVHGGSAGGGADAAQLDGSADSGLAALGGGSRGSLGSGAAGSGGGTAGGQTQHHAGSQRSANKLFHGISLLFFSTTPGNRVQHRNGTPICTFQRCIDRLYYILLAQKLQCVKSPVFVFVLFIIMVKSTKI